jgi:hypothetical protein
MPADEDLKSFWSREALDMLLKVIADSVSAAAMFAVNAKPPSVDSSLLETWREFCGRYDIQPGSPEWYVKKAYYGRDVVADRYDIEEFPVYWDWKNSVVVRNPFFAEDSKEEPLKWRWLEIDAELAMKILVLGFIP